jgi:hypothetical protein
MDSVDRLEIERQLFCASVPEDVEQKSGYRGGFEEEAGKWSQGFSFKL